MARARLAIVTKQLTTPAMEAKQAPQLELPAAVSAVLYEIQNRLFQVKGVFASIYALAEANDDSGDVRYAMEAALEMFDPVIESIEPACVKRAVAERGAS